MSNPLLSAFELAGQQIDIRDSASYELATAAQQVAYTAGATATAAQQAVDNIIAGFNTQYTQIPTNGNLIAPYYCKRNNTVFIEFPNILFLGNVPANTWTKVFTLPDGYRPVSTCYRMLSIAGTVLSLVEIHINGSVKFYPTQPFTSKSAVFGGFSFLTI